ncbi:opsin, ultraviolet-sensitive-like [Cylas formicarius]|uniref:opsin, ultraviolet-sensitive-like n=1 Tax=Cylas formicarius TaxID=197179 RepID=UPI0029586C54|nr:opsin, ultraviolet-sensitive-like [Cylas formicarius]
MNATENALTMCNVTTTQEECNIVSNLSVEQRFRNAWPVNDWKPGFFLEDHIRDINRHWLKFDPPPYSQYVFLAVLYTAIMLVGILGNCLVVYMFVRCKPLRTASNTLVVNLAISDLLMMSKMPVFVYNCMYSGPILGNIGCQFYGFLGGLTGTVSIMTLSAISLDRFLVIKYPFKLKYTKMRIKICLVFCWCYGLSFSVIPLLDIGFGKYQYEGFLTSCSFDYLSETRAVRYFILAYFTAAFIVPMSAITFSYIGIVKVVGSRSIGSKRESFRHVTEEDKHKQELKLAVVVLLVIFLWFFSWTPYATVALLGVFHQKQFITPVTSMIPALFCKMASAVDPFFYAVSHPKFRLELQKMFCNNSEAKRRKKQKVWSTRHMKRDRFQSNRTISSDVEEDIVEIELTQNKKNFEIEGRN